MNIISKMQNNMFAENAFGIEVKVSREMANASLIEFIPAYMKIDASTLHDDELYWNKLNGSDELLILHKEHTKTANASDGNADMSIITNKLEFDLHDLEQFID